MMSCPGLRRPKNRWVNVIKEWGDGMKNESNYGSSAGTTLMGTVADGGFWAWYSSEVSSIACGSMIEMATKTGITRVC